MYDFILTEKLLTALAALLLSVLAACVVGRPGLWWRGLAYSYMPGVAVAFFAVAPWAPEYLPWPDVLAGLLFEFAVLCLYYWLLGSLFDGVLSIRQQEVRRLLLATLGLQLALAAPLVLSEGFGIFSDGSRIDYLYAGSLSKYLVYAGIICMGIQAPLLARQISCKGNIGWLGGMVVLFNFAMSILAGSKGGAFLWIFSVLALVNYRQARLSLMAMVLLPLLLVGGIYVSSLQISEFLGITLEDFADLALNRFFLNNDARALAFDFRTSLTSDAGLLSEAFRSLASLFGSAPKNSPLGVHLYAELFGFESGNGANASLIALIVYYSSAGYALLPALLFTAGAGALVLFFGVVRRQMQSAVCRAIVLAFGLLALQQYSQDFLAFQVVLPLVIVFLFLVWIYDDTNYRRDVRNWRRRVVGAAA